mgnify:CR=1 FL=1
MVNCRICGKECQGIIDIADDNAIYCDNCYLALRDCPGCIHSAYCAFQQDTSIQEPPMIEQTIQQGPMVMTKTVPNPKRIELTCKKCSCWKEEGCCRQDGWCNNHERIKI